MHWFWRYEFMNLQRRCNLQNIQVPLFSEQSQVTTPTSQNVEASTLRGNSRSQVRQKLLGSSNYGVTRWRHNRNEISGNELHDTVHRGGRLLKVGGTRAGSFGVARASARPGRITGALAKSTRATSASDENICKIRRGKKDGRVDTFPELDRWQNSAAYILCLDFQSTVSLRKIKEIPLDDAREWR